MPKSEGPEQSSKTRLRSQQRTPSPRRENFKPPTNQGTMQRPWESFLGTDFSQGTFERHAALLGDSRLSYPVNKSQRVQIVQQFQRTYGNRYVQRLVAHISQKKIGVVQPKLEVGPAGDKFEKEADRLVKRVISRISSSNGTAGYSEDRPGEEIQRLSETEEVVGLEGGAVESSVEQSIEKTRGGGEALPDKLRASMEDAFNTDFGGVRVHTNAASDALNRSMSARAFTTGNDIFFAKGEYNPDSKGGQETLAHELTHVVQQTGDSKRQTETQKEPNDTKSDNQPAKTVQVRGTLDDATRRAIQRAIGLEIEVAVPVDQLTEQDLQDLRDAAGTDPNNIPTLSMEVEYKIMSLRNKKVKYTRDGGLKARGGNHYRVEVDHDPRVMAEKTPAFPYRDMANKALMEIVMDPPANDQTEFEAAMKEIDDFVKDVNVKTNNLTKHSEDPYGTGYNIGPIDYPALGPMKKEDNHNWQGSIQVNIGIDLREYASMAKWYAGSSYANPKKAEQGARDAYKKAKDNIVEAVNVGRALTDQMMKSLSSDNKKAFGNLRGFRGWVTHVALYLIGGREGLPMGSTVKNVTPILMKSPGQIAAAYGMTESEREWFEDNRDNFMAELMNKCKRNDLDPTKDLDQLAIAKGTEGTDEGYTLDQLSETRGDPSQLDQLTAPVAAGAAVNDPTAVGPERKGSKEVSGIESVGNTGQRGGVVVEFRNLPGLYEGVSAWKKLGKKFLEEAETRNKREGTKPKKNPKNVKN